jgi:DNA-directed RNA polymerase specialized sigma24 family protein
MPMWKELFRRKGSAAGPDAARERLTLELAEIEEISEKLFRRIAERLEALKTLETRLDEKASRVESLIARASGIGAAQADAAEARRRGVIALAQKGLKADEIAEIFDMTRGEVDLVLNLGRQ